jgi:hypothetical protein
MDIRDVLSVETQLLVFLTGFGYMFRFQSIHHQALFKTNTKYNAIICHYIISAIYRVIHKFQRVSQEPDYRIDICCVTKGAYIEHL